MHHSSALHLTHLTHQSAGDSSSSSQPPPPHPHTHTSKAGRGAHTTMSGGHSNNVVFPVTLLAFQLVCAVIWLVGGDYAIGTPSCLLRTVGSRRLWGGQQCDGVGSCIIRIHTTDASGKASDSNPHSWTPTSLYRCVGGSVRPSSFPHKSLKTRPSPRTQTRSMWIGVHIMMLFGFGNLMTFLHRYGYSASGYTFVMTCIGALSARPITARNEPSPTPPFHPQHPPPPRPHIMSHPARQSPPCPSAAPPSPFIPSTTHAPLISPQHTHPAPTPCHILHAKVRLASPQHHLAIHPQHHPRNKQPPPHPFIPPPRPSAAPPSQSSPAPPTQPTPNTHTHTGIQWCIINYYFWHSIFQGKIVGPTLDVAALFQGDFGVAAVLISFGGLLGKVSPSQLLWLCFFEVVFYAISETIISDVSE